MTRASTAMGECLATNVIAGDISAGMIDLADGAATPIDALLCAESRRGPSWCS